jgi:hypothetical protein
MVRARQVCVIVALQPVKIEAVTQVSMARKLGVVARVAAQQAGRSRTLSAFMKGARATARAFGHVAHQLWLEVTGFVFLAMAGLGAVALVREYAKYQSGRATAGRIAVAICFTVTFAWFGVTSFWRVRKRRS